MALTLDDLRSSESIQLISPPPTKREDNRYPWSLSVTNDTTTLTATTWTASTNYGYDADGNRTTVTDALLHAK